MWFGGRRVQSAVNGDAHNSADDSRNRGEQYDDDYSATDHDDNSAVDHNEHHAGNDDDHVAVRRRKSLEGFRI